MAPGHTLAQGVVKSFDRVSVHPHENDEQNLMRLSLASVLPVRGKPTTSSAPGPRGRSFYFLISFFMRMLQKIVRHAAAATARWPSSLEKFSNQSGNLIDELSTRGMVSQMTKRALWCTS